MNLEQFTQIFPACKNPEVWVPQMDLLQDFSITTTDQVAQFCAQIGHESADMKFLEENLNYSADSLVKIFPKYFDNLTAAALARKPEDIANVVYANRMGNGDTSQGDGWKFRGRGILQITGKDSYKACSGFLYSDENVLLDRPELLADDPKTSMMSALWFWNTNKLHLLNDVATIQKRVNGGTNGMEDRVMRYERALSVLS